MRWLLAKHLVDLIRDHGACAGVQVTPAWPGDRNQTAEMIWLGDIEGVMALPVGVGGRKPRDDKFDLRVLFRVAQLADLDATLSRLFELVGAVEDVLADDPTLAEFDGVLSAEAGTCNQAVMTTPDGVVAFGLIEIAVHSRLT